jgi:predicted nucleic-acid-binding Zn-ribbon protein
MDKNRQELVISALKEKGALLPCPRCRNLEFEVIGEGMVEISHDESKWHVGAYHVMLPAVPVILVSCNNCGYIAYHARAVLGLPKGS